jgi:hypothetical protein
MPNALPAASSPERSSFCSLVGEGSGLPGGYPGGRRITIPLESYLHGLQRVAQFAIYERLFSLWHLLHIPLVALLILSAVFHVIAVHMY